MLEPLIKWTGSKRYVASDIIQRFPKEGDVYCEPFLGGGSVLLSLLESTEHTYERIIGTDINLDLVNLWNQIITQPETLLTTYNTYWHQINNLPTETAKKTYYNELRAEFNRTRSTELFMLLTRLSMNGLVRYNKKQEFNVSYHFGRTGIKPERLAKNVYHWSEQLNNHHVLITQCSYERIPTDSLVGVVYCDPPYANTTDIYSQVPFSLPDFLAWGDTKVTGNWFLTYNGDNQFRVGTEKTTIPSHYYDEKIPLRASSGSFKRLFTQNESPSQENLYIRWGGDS